MKLDDDKQIEIEDFCDKLETDNGLYIRPWFDINEPKFMAIFDSATATEEKNKAFTESKGFTTIAKSFRKFGLSKSDGYWTGLFKRSKRAGEKIFSNKDSAEAFEILKEEIELLKPPLIVCFGSAIARMFEPSLKGGVIENCGKIMYSADLDCNILFAFNTAQIHFNPDYEILLDEVSETISELI